MDGSSDYGYAMFLKTTNVFPSYTKEEGRFVYINGNNNFKDFTSNTVLKGGSEYYLYVGYRIDANSTSTNGQFIINSINIYGLNVEATKLEVNRGSIKAETSGSSFNVCAIYNEDELIITNGNFCGYNTCQINSSSYSYGGFGVYNISSLEIAEGRFIGKNQSYYSSSADYKVAGIYNNSLEAITINNATIEESYNGIYNDGNGVANISNINISSSFNYKIRNKIANTVFLTGYCTFNNGYVLNIGTFIIEGAEISGGYIYNSRILKMNGGKITGSDYGIYNTQTGKVEINNGIITATSSGIHMANENNNAVTGNIHIVRGTIEGDSYGIYGLSDYSTPITIGEKDGVVDNSQIKIVGKTKTGINTTGDIKFYDGVIHGKEAAILGVVVEKEDGYSVCLEESEEIVSGEKAILNSQTGIAYIEPDNTVLYDTLQAAIEACDENEIVTLTKDIVMTADDCVQIDESKKVTINLNSKEIIALGRFITNYGDTKITDLTEEASGNIKASDKIVIVNQQSGKLTVEKVEIENISNGSNLRVIYNKGELNIESGILDKVSSGYAIYNEGKLREDIAGEVLGEWVNLGEYYFEETTDGKHTSNNKIAGTTANSYVKIDLNDKIGSYFLNVNIDSLKTNYDYGKIYATIKDNNDEIVSYDDEEGRFIYATGYIGTGIESKLLLEGGKEYYLYFGFVNENETYAAKSSFTINSIKLQKMEVAVTNIRGGILYSGAYNTKGILHMTEGEIQNGSIYNSEDGFTKFDGGSLKSSISNYGNLEMTGGSITSSTGINNHKNGNCKMIGGTINANTGNSSRYGIVNDGFLEMTGGEIKTNGYTYYTGTNYYGYGIRVDSSISVTQIKGGSISIGKNGRGIYNEYTALVEITKLTITGSGEKSYGIYNVSTGSIVLGKKDGISTIEDISVKIAGGYGVSNQKGSLRFYDGIIGGKEEQSILGIITDYEDKYTLVTYKYGETETYEVEENQEVSLLEKIFVAHVASNDTQYEDIYEAIENLADADIDTLTILHDISTNEEIGPFTISEDKEVILDLNGYTLQGNTEPILLNKGKLTIKDSREGGTINARALAIHNKGSLKVESGDIKATATNSCAVYNEATGGEEITEEVLGELTSIGSYYFVENEGQYTINMNNRTGKASSYVKIDLRNKEGVYVLDVSASVASYKYNYGYVTLKNATSQTPEYYDEDGRLIYISGTQTASASTVLVGGVEYYLYFGFYKNYSYTTEDYECVIESLKISKNITETRIQGGNIDVKANTGTYMYAYAIKNAAYLEVSGGNMTIYAGTCSHSYAYGIQNTGITCVTGGNITVSASCDSSFSDVSAAAYGISNSVNAKVDFNNGTINSKASGRRNSSIRNI